MRDIVSFLYWLAVGIVVVVGIYASVFGNLFPYFLLIALVMAVVGIWQPGIKEHGHYWSGSAVSLPRFSLQTF